MVRAFQNALTVDYGTKSTCKHSHILKLHNSCVRICESSRCFLATFLICSHCNCLLNNLTIDYGTKSTYKHYHILKIHNSYVKICVRSCCFLAVFLICSHCDIVSIVTRAIVKVAVVTAITS
jgi:hypothetical protein